MAEVHKHNIPGFLLGSREILLIDTISQCNCMENCLIGKEVNSNIKVCIFMINVNLGGTNMQSLAKPCSKTHCTNLQSSRS